MGGTQHVKSEIEHEEIQGKIACRNLYKPAEHDKPHFILSKTPFVFVLHGFQHHELLIIHYLSPRYYEFSLLDKPAGMAYLTQHLCFNCIRRGFVIKEVRLNEIIKGDFGQEFPYRFGLCRNIAVLQFCFLLFSKLIGSLLIIESIHRPLLGNLTADNRNTGRKLLVRHQLIAFKNSFMIYP